MSSLRRTVRGFSDRIAALVGRMQVRWISARSGHRDVTVLDIDNTLADTWPTLLEEWPDNRSRLAALRPLPGVKAVAHDPAAQSGGTVVFISHRNWWEWPTTRRWLRTHGFAVGWVNLVLVANPADKLGHLETLAARAATVTLWDDVSHSHETGTMGFYDEVLARLETLPVVHHGWDDIRAAVDGSD